MERGLYAAASGMIAQQSQQDIIAQNIANVNTVAYKQDGATFQAAQGMALQRIAGGQRPADIGQLGSGVHTGNTFTDWQAGPLEQTNNPLDASLGASQFFAVKTSAGERYTRAGNLTTDGAGNLITASGQQLIGADGNVINAAGKPSLGLDRSGNVTSAGQPIAKLKIVQIDPSTLAKDGDNLYAATLPAAVKPAVTPDINPGTLEMSNVSPVRGLVQLITIGRSFDMANKAIRTQDDMLRHAANDVGHT